MIDIEVARTFLAVIDTGTFQGAAKTVHVTQSTVSARIKTLEDRLGVPVFIRSKAGATLTSGGHHFERYARSIVRGWEQGRYQAGLPERYDELLVVGGQYNLWARFLTSWLNLMRDSLPTVAFRAEAGAPSYLSQLVGEGLIDIAVLNQPNFRPDIEVEHLLDDVLILVTADPNGAFADRYVFVDWGQAYRDWHTQKLPELMDPRTSVSIGFFGARFLISSGTAGYMPRRLVQPHIDAGFLFKAAGAPEFSYPVFAAYHNENHNSALKKALKLLRTQAHLVSELQLPDPFWMNAPSDQAADV